MTVTMKDIAHAAGVSTATVSKVLNGLDEHISEETRQKIWNLKEKMGYVPNNFARGLKKKSSGTIGFILPDIANPFFPEIARGIQDEARKEDFAVVMCNTGNNAEAETKAIEFLTSKMVDGIIYTRSVMNVGAKEIKTIDVPVVAVDRRIHAKKLGFGQVYVDAVAGIHEATNVLIRHGCRKIACISAKYPTSGDRIEGYRQALKEARMTVRESLIYLDSFDVSTGYAGTEKLLHANPSIDGIVCGDDLIAFGVLHALRDHRKRIPEDIKVIGFDDIYFAKYSTPALTTIRQPAYEMGKEAAHMMISHLLNGTPLSSLKFDYSIEMRETV